MRYIVMSLLVLWLLLAGCDMAKDTKTTAEKGEKGAVGLAEKMKGGTVGEADEDSGESSGEESGN